MNDSNSEMKGWFSCSQSYRHLKRSFGGVLSLIVNASLLDISI